MTPVRIAFNFKIQKVPIIILYPFTLNELHFITLATLLAYNYISFVEYCVKIVKNAT